MKGSGSHIAAWACLAACLAVVMDVLCALWARGQDADFEGFTRRLIGVRFGDVLFVLMGALAAGLGAGALVKAVRARRGKRDGALACVAIFGPALMRPVVGLFLTGG